MYKSECHPYLAFIVFKLELLLVHLLQLQSFHISEELLG